MSVITITFITFVGFIYLRMLKNLVLLSFGLHEWKQVKDSWLIPYDDCLTLSQVIRN